MPRGRQNTTAPGVHHLYRPPQRHLPTLGPQITPVTDREVAEALERAKRLREVRIAHARRDPNAFMEYCFLDDDGVPLSQAWFHEDWQQFITDNKRAMIIAPRGHGKCVASGTLIHAADGRLVPVEKWEGGELLSLDPVTMKVVPSWSPPVEDNGMKGCVEVVTRSGRKITTTTNHPFLRGLEWVDASELRVGDRVGVMYGSPSFGESTDTQECWVIGLLVGDGYTRTGLCFSASPLESMLIARASLFFANKGWGVSRQGSSKNDYRVTWGGDQYSDAKNARHNGPRRWLRQIGLYGCDSFTKLVPEVVLSSSSSGYWSFLSGYFDADGSASKIHGQCVEFYSVNKGLLSTVQHMLSRVGCESSLSVKNGRYNGDVHKSFRLTLRGRSARVFAANYCGYSTKGERLKSWVNDDSISGSGNGDTVHSIPFGVWKPLVKNIPERLRESGCRVDTKRSMSREKVARLGIVDDNSTLVSVAFSDVSWDEVVSIKPVGLLQTWAIEVPGNENFVADGFITHNTTQLVGRIIWELGRNPNLRIKIVCASDSKATDRLFEIVQHMNYNPRVREVFPKLVQADYGDFTKHKIVVRRTARHRDASVEALGIGATATGGRADILFADDVVDRRNALSFPALRESIKQSWRSDWTQLLVPSGKIVYICTLWHKKDLSHELMVNPAFRVLRYDVTKALEAIWPEVWSSPRLTDRRVEIGPLEFDRAYRNIPQDVSEGIVRPEFVRYTDTGAVSLDDIIFVLSYDVAIGQNAGDSYFACVVFAVDKRRKIAYVYDAYHARLSVPEQEAQVVADWQQFRADLVLVEGVGGFGALAQYLKRNHPGMPVAKVVPRGDKAARLSRVTPYMSAGQVLFDKSLEPKPDEHHNDRGDLVTELFDFPLAQNNDLCDAFSQGMDEIGMRYLDAVVDSTGATKIRVHTNTVHNVVKYE